MNCRDADALAGRLAQSLAAGNVIDAYVTIQPVLEQRTPFRLLDRIAATAGPGQWPETSAFLDHITAYYGL
jgi:hypothetical protein